ncbi:MAG: EscU/YscU/HrcU family type III secretion system export apparatus switch protein [Deltaproteobacteria bacterium]|nr:EscU/YscU/HrcU family type III secretion system export apparatus switch protein [Deltaproteobacteria bacterium]
MPWQEDRHERTEKASPRRRQEARDRGQVARSKEAVSVAVLMTGVGVFYFFGQAMVESLGVIMSGFLSGSSSFDMTRQGLHSALTRTLKDVSYPFLPLLLFPAAGIAANMAQVGLLVTAEPLMPKFSRINPL